MKQSFSVIRYTYCTLPCEKSSITLKLTMYFVGVSRIIDFFLHKIIYIPCISRYLPVYTYLISTSISESRDDYFIVGVTDTHWSVSAPVRGAYPLCGQYPSTATTSRMRVNCTSSTPPGRYVIIQQPANGAGQLNIGELEVYSNG